jgi:WD40 repeat protein
MVTDSGSLIIYNINVIAKPWVRIAAHDGEASSVDWHPTQPYLIATGGASDRTVKGK